MTPTLDSFISRWGNTSAAERANYQMFLSELADVLGVQRPDPKGPITEENIYVFDRDITFQNPDGTTSPGYIDLYKREFFVLETKQGSEKTTSDDGFSIEAKKKKKRGTAVRGTKGWDDAMLKAYHQAVGYVRALPVSEGNPPFVVVVDVGFSFELYSDFSRAGKSYIPFPDARNYRIMFKDLEKPEVQELLRTLWTDPMALDPSRRAAKITREVAIRLARLAKSLEESGHAPELVATFLMRCLFTMFAEDVKLIPERSFTEMLEMLRDERQVAIFPQMAETLWQTMNSGGFSPMLKKTVLRFNGGLFENPQAIPLTATQLDLLIEAGQMDWRDVEPTIFGTLLERALDPMERHKLGAHYTPRAYVERLVMPTIIEPLREEWDAVRAAAVTLQRDGKPKEAIAELRAFHRNLCTLRVLDPACGSGNFLYVTLEHLKRLEGEVLELMEQFGENIDTLEFTELTVDPHQLLGIEINPRAAAIAEMVLWIGYLQWHFRTHGDTLPREPVLQNYHNIECRDAVLEYDRTEPTLDDGGKQVTRWDGHTYKKHPVTREDVPDEAAHVPVLRYINPRKAEWPETEYVVGNPPFLGDKRMRDILGSGYVDALRQAYSALPESSDYVMYWWHRAAELTHTMRVHQFGLITTNSIRQTFNRRTVETFLLSVPPLIIAYAVPDHPWVDASDGAAVRISMTVGTAHDQQGILETVVAENTKNDGETDVLLSSHIGRINPYLRIGADLSTIISLHANEQISCNGVGVYGRGFILTPVEARNLGFEKVAGIEKYVKPILTGRDLIINTEQRFGIDLLGLTEVEVSLQFPAVYQWILNRVKPEREQNNRESYRRLWWIFGEPRKSFRPVLSNLTRFIATPRTARHRFFTFVPANTIVETEIIMIALDDLYHLGILSSKVHVGWALAAGTRLGVGNDPRYNNSRCFVTFPFPRPSDLQKERIGALAERLDAHRKRQQSQHPKLSITDMYNVLEKLRSREELTTKDRQIHEQGLVSILKQIHDDLDEAVFDAYGWPATLSDEEILERLVALNAERAAEERAGLIRWLRSEYQHPKGSATQTAFVTDEENGKPAVVVPAAKAEKSPWPKPLKEQLQAVRAALAAQASAATADQLAKSFKGARVDRVAEILDSLSALGQVREVEEGRFVV